jgi:hypothetical protein
VTANLDLLSALIIATALSVMAGGGYIAGTGQGGRITMVVLSVILIAIAFVFLIGRVLAAV